MYIDTKSDRKKYESMVIFAGLFMCNNILIWNTTTIY